MLEKLLELLAALAVAVAGAAGLNTAEEHITAADPGVAIDQLGSVELAEERAALEAAAGLARAADAVASGGGAGIQIETAEGLETAADALQQAMENAPDAADPGLQEAWTQVTTNPAASGELPTNAAGISAAPVEVPAGNHP